MVALWVNLSVACTCLEPNTNPAQLNNKGVSQALGIDKVLEQSLWG
jgi:hypothetical protein